MALYVMAVAVGTRWRSIVQMDGVVIFRSRGTLGSIGAALRIGESWLERHVAPVE